MDRSFRPRENSSRRLGPIAVRNDLWEKNKILRSSLIMFLEPDQKRYYRRRVMSVTRQNGRGLSFFLKIPQDSCTWCSLTDGHPLPYLLNSNQDVLPSFSGVSCDTSPHLCVHPHQTLDSQLPISPQETPRTAVAKLALWKHQGNP